MSNRPLKLRFPPSPTGFLHVGGLRTALFNFLHARKNGGQLILRIEDTDRQRFVEGATENIAESLHDFNLQPDEGVYWDNGVKEKGQNGPYFQSKRLEIYKKYVDQLLEKKTAYYCFCTPERLDQLRESQQAQKLAPRYDKLCLNLTDEEIQKNLSSGMSYVIRMNVVAGEKISFKDLVHGEISIDTRDVDDQVLMKSDGYPTYHLANVVDDYLMGVTVVMRGEEWIPSTPKHILLYQAFGWEVPDFAHLPLLLSKTKKKLSKRDGDVAVKDFLANGYLPEALINFVAFLGWNPKTEQEIFSLDELIKEFTVEKINKSGAVFDLDKLDWINGLYIRKLTLDQLQEKTEPFLKLANIPFENFPKDFIQEVLRLERDRLKKLSEIGERVQYFFVEPQYDGEILVWKKSTKEETQKNLQAIYSFIHEIPADKFNAADLEIEIKKFISNHSLTTGEVLWPLRAALSGLSASPGPFEIMGAFGKLKNGKEIILKRINTAIEKL